MATTIGTGQLAAGSGRAIVQTSIGTAKWAISVNLGSVGDVALQVWLWVNDVEGWNEIDASNAPPKYVTEGAISKDSSGTIVQFIYAYVDTDAPTNYQARYGTANGNAYVIDELIADAGTTIKQVAIATDSNDIPHVVYVGNPGGANNYDTVYYANRVGGGWNVVEVEGFTATKDCIYPDILINQNDIPVISYINETDDTLTRATGNQNNANAFTLVDLNTDTLPSGTSICMDSDNTIWVGFTIATDNIVACYEDTTLRTTGEPGFPPSIVANGTDIYLLYYYPNAIRYDKWSGSAFDGEVTLNTGTLSNVKAKWSYLNNDDGDVQIDYIFKDSAYVYWDRLSLVGWSGEINGVTNPSEINGIAVANISTVNGI